MSKAEIVKPYKKEHGTSYTSGAYATLELLEARPELVRKVFLHSACAHSHQLLEKCGEHNLPAVWSDEAFRRVNQKENAYVLGIFDKYTSALRPDKAHVVLVHPADMGNLGTILRTAVGLNLSDLAVIAPAADIFHPKTVRASMGALFRLRFAVFGSFADYRAAYPDHAAYPFMLDGQELPEVLRRAAGPLFALIFGNEATGLPGEFASVGTAVKIPQSPLVDSLNVSVAVGIGAYAFAGKFGLVG